MSVVEAPPGTRLFRVEWQDGNSQVLAFLPTGPIRWRAADVDPYIEELRKGHRGAAYFYPHDPPLTEPTMVWYDGTEPDIATVVEIPFPAPVGP